jgi:hypothetical protein
MNERFHDDADRLLNGLAWTRQDTQAVLAATKGERPEMKKKIRAGLVLAVSLLLVAAVALAIGLSKSPEYAVLEKARQTVCEQYGLKPEWLTMFNTTTGRVAGKQIVLFDVTSSTFVQPDAVGKYTVEIAADGQATASWSHDDVDPSLWQNADLTASVWGAPQLEQMFARYTAYRTWWAEHENVYELPLAQQTALFAELQQTLAPLPLPPECSARTGNTAPLATPTPVPVPAAALTAAKEELSAKYALTDDMLSLFTLNASVDSSDGQPVWVVAYNPVDYDNPGVADWRWLDFLSERLGSYQVQVRQSDNTVVQVRWSLEGEKRSDTYTENNWAQADAYDARILPWVLSLLRANAPIIARYPEDQTEWFSVQDAAAYDQAFRDAGFNANVYNHGLPQPGDLTQEQALQCARQAMREAYSLTDEQLKPYTLTASYLLDQGGTWQISFYSGDGMGNVDLRAADGEVQTVQLDSGVIGNG